MNFEKALKLADAAVFAKTNTHLRDKAIAINYQMQLKEIFSKVRECPSPKLQYAQKNILSLLDPR